MHVEVWRPPEGFEACEGGGVSCGPSLKGLFGISHTLAPAPGCLVLQLLPLLLTFGERGAIFVHYQVSSTVPGVCWNSRKHEAASGGRCDV